MKKILNITILATLLLFSKINYVNAESKSSISNKEKINRLDKALVTSTIHGHTGITISHKDLISITKEAIYIQGDLDGDIIRLIHAAFMSGYIEFTENGLELFIDLIETENKILLEYSLKPKSDSKFGELIACQDSSEIYEKINRLMKHIKYTTSIYKLICIGDIMFDRFTNNLFAVAELIINLHNHGVIFIKGNHDFTDLIDRFSPIREKYGMALGYYCKDIENIKNNPIQRKKITDAIDKFVLAYYEPEFKILFTHAALEERKIDGANYVFYCNELCGPINISPEELLKKLQSFSHLKSDDMALSRAKEDSKFKMPNVLLVHGHDGVADDSLQKPALDRAIDCKDILCVNARFNGYFAEALTVIIKLPPK